MTGRDLKVIRTFDNRIQAEIARSVLASSKILSYIRGDDPGSSRVAFFPAVIDLVVRAADAEEANAILAAGEAQSGQP